MLSPYGPLELTIALLRKVGDWTSQRVRRILGYLNQPAITCIFDCMMEVSAAVIIRSHEDEVK